MPRTRSFLQRFRGAGAPGAASAVGVPADRVAETAAELEPVFDRLAPVQAECEAIRARARQDAELTRRRADERAAAVLAAARANAEAERVAASLAAGRRVDDEREQALTAADEQAERVRRHAAEAMPRYVDRVVEQARLLLDGHDQPGAPVP
ncbi:hypothetical protein [Nocardioides sp. T2.26MG-1]|uniref:hypothetical protein n=1 Tax=Nocardioides sp. T2.26MG-1 TaxID=3041166 RepID=UPI002477A97B|nr:hypothetical protein [Nocardioides sp. T2.26MG-1]CAI9400336.1 hypothetical protein HIDPHFAB_00381 [Nocardioides sp. T2.26MG-1]